MLDNVLKMQLKDFKVISLNHLNATATLLKRIEKKYLLNSTDFLSILGELKKNYNILEIDGKKVFNYDNVYMDTEDYLFYNQHNQKLNSRVKVRTRFYVDSNLAYFEFKHNTNGITHKYRYEFLSHEHGFMTKGKKRFFDGIWQSIYGTPAPDITPSMKTNYKRITMVSKKGDERITFDFGVTATNLRKDNAHSIELKNLIIMESKSLKGISLADKLMQKYKIRRSHYCSKYSLGIIYSGLAEKYDTFKDTMEKIKKIRMETVKEGRKNSTERSGSLQKIIKDIKKETKEGVNQIV